MLTRMRQLALHPGLIPVDYLEQLQAEEDHGENPPAIRITPADKVRLQSQLTQIIEDSEVTTIRLTNLLLSSYHATGMSCLLWYPHRSEDNRLWSSFLLCLHQRGYRS